MKEKRYEAAYAGFVYEAPATHWTPSTVVRQRLTKMDFTKPDGIELGGMPIISDGQTAFVDAADGHTAVLACSGMKKSICGFMPRQGCFLGEADTFVYTVTYKPYSSFPAG